MLTSPYGQSETFIMQNIVYLTFMTFIQIRQVRTDCCRMILIVLGPHTNVNSSSDRLRFVGQSVIRFTHQRSPLKRPDWKRAVEAWVKRSKASLPVDASDILVSYKTGNAWSAYTQMIWDFSYLVGCGYSMFREDKATPQPPGSTRSCTSATTGQREFLTS